MNKKLSAQKPRRPSGCRGTDRMCQRQGRVPLHRPQSGGMYLPGRGQPTPDGLRHHSSRRMERCSRSFVGNGRKGTRRGEPDYYRRRQYDRQRAGDTHHRLGRRSRTANQNQPARAGQRIRSVPQTRYLLAGSRLVTQRKICPVVSSPPSLRTTLFNTLPHSSISKRANGHNSVLIQKLYII